MPRRVSEEAPSMSRPNPAPTTRRGLGRRKLLAAIGLLTLVAGVGVVNALPSEDTASALPPPPIPPTNPTTIPTLPPTTGTAPPTPPWKVSLLKLNQDVGPGAPALGAIAADRYWLPRPIIATQTATKTATQTVAAGTGSIYDPIPAGTANLSNNQFSFPGDPMPAGYDMVLRVREAGIPGSLCRTRPVGALPASGRPLHLLIAPPISKSASELNALVAGFKGVVPNTPAGISVNIVNATLTPSTSGLQLYLLGGLFVNNTWAFVFDYRVTLTLVPVNGTDVNSALTAQTTGAGTLQLAWLGTPPAGGDAIKAFIAQGMEPQLRANVVSTARPLVNDAVVQNHDVRWWTEQGFSVSVRRVTYSGSDLKVSAALCRLS
jgi:hypothetical protein